jgi:hypothetical protein
MEPDDPPPTVDADYRLVRGPWPRWMLHLSLIKLAVWTGVIVAIFIVIALLIVWRLRPV